MNTKCRNITFDTQSTELRMSKTMCSEVTRQQSKLRPK